MGNKIIPNNPVEIKIGSKLRVYLHTGEEYTGTFLQVSLGLDKSHPEEPSIMLGDAYHSSQGYGMATIFTRAIKYMMLIERPLYAACPPDLFIPLGTRLEFQTGKKTYSGTLSDLTLLLSYGKPSVVVSVSLKWGYLPTEFSAQRITKMQISNPLEEKTDEHLTG